MLDLLSRLNSIAWGPWMLILLVGTGIYYSFKLGFIQFSKFGYALKNTIGKIFTKTEAKEGEITPFQAVSTALAATVGTGNIAGVTGAIAIGGPGAVFWMWISALFGMATKYSEIVLAVKYREKNENGEWAGGPMYYIKNGLPKKYRFLAVIFCILGAVAAIGTGGMTQINTISLSINTTLESFGIHVLSHGFMFFGQLIPYSSIIIGVIIAIVTAMVLFGGIKRIGSATEMIVPIMAVVYVGVALILVAANFQYIDDIFMLIIKGAFNAKAALGGAVGITILHTIRNGIGRGVFSNEAGLGTAPMAHALTSETNPVKQGMYGIFEIFMDTIVICTLTAFILLVGHFNGVVIPWGNNAGINLISASLGTLFGNQMSSFILAICITLFALSTILTWSLYGARCCGYLFGDFSMKIYQWVFIFFLVVGSCLELDVVWVIAETFNGFMAIPNLIALLLLSPVVVKLTKEYFSKENEDC